MKLDLLEPPPDVLAHHADFVCAIARSADDLDSIASRRDIHGMVAALEALLDAPGIRRMGGAADALRQQGYNVPT
jgi:hypothetical protein